MSTEITNTKTKPRDAIIVQDDSAIGYLMDTAKFEHIYRIANAMASSTLTPKHLQGGSLAITAANCFRVVNQAIRWGFDPFAVADETYVVHGRLGYQGKLVAAVIQTRAGISGRLVYTYEGSGLDRTVTVAGQFAGEGSHRTIQLSVRQAKTENDMWTKDPDQKLAYSGAIKWARRYCPEVIMGVLTDDDLERIAESKRNDAQAQFASKSDAVAAVLTQSNTVKNVGEESQVDPQVDPVAAHDAADRMAMLGDLLSACATAEEVAKVREEFIAGGTSVEENAIAMACSGRLSEIKATTKAKAPKGALI